MWATAGKDLVAQDEAPVPFRLSPAKEENTASSAVEAVAKERPDGETPKAGQTAGKETAPAGSGVITGEVGSTSSDVNSSEPDSSDADSSGADAGKGPSDSAESREGSDAEEKMEVAARSGFRMSARKPGPDESDEDNEPDETESAPPGAGLMGPPPPSELPGGDTPPRKEVSKTGGGSLGRAISSHFEGEPVGSEEPEALARPGPVGQSAQLLSDREPLHFAPEVHPGQQGESYSAADAAQPVDGTSTHVDTYLPAGFFPTQDDHLYIGDSDYPRGGPGSGAGGYGAVGGFGPTANTWIGPDARSLGFTGIFPYQDPEVNFYDRHAYFFDPLDRGLGFSRPTTPS